MKATQYENLIELEIVCSDCIHRYDDSLNENMDIEKTEAPDMLRVTEAVSDLDTPSEACVLCGTMKHQVPE